jgi:hypothetical protein
MMEKDITLNDLVKDWTTKINDTTTVEWRTYYSERLRDVLRWDASDEFDVIPYRKDNGEYSYNVRVKEDGK